MRRTAAIAALSLCAAVAAFVPQAQAAEFDLVVETTQVASGLQRPTAIAAPDDGSGRLFIAEKAGRVRVYHPTTGLAAAPLVDVSAAVSTSGNERGLLGIAPSPPTPPTARSTSPTPGSATTRSPSPGTRAARSPSC
ncbi:hypothetical protein ACFQV2_16350 [Actinokineospora soli]|uniref:Lactonase, 7-bladed beta-propeller n=1 Tax=Actinokineospora soli TaxID=1048753 RepID=A0ABW2TM65_9PSEU